jgi:multiple sugar transport system permease protein
MTNAEQTQGPTGSRSGLEAPNVSRTRLNALTTWFDSVATNIFILPAVLVILFLALVPLFLSLYVSLTRLSFSQGSFVLTFVGLDNYAKLLVGIDHVHFLGLWADPSPIGWLVLGLVILAFAGWLIRYVRGGDFAVGGLVGRIVVASVVTVLVWIMVQTIANSGRPGTVGVTVIYVFVDMFFQYMIGLGLAMLCIQHIPGRRFFRVVFLLPMMITPVGVAYTFRMLADTYKGPFYPVWIALGLGGTSWADNAWGARIAVMIGDIWQWTPFMFIVLLAALESQSIEEVEAAVVDGANQWQIFWSITLPSILPVSTTLILIRMIEAFKIIDLPNVLTNGGPGTATESMSLHAYTIWRVLDVGGSAAVAYMLLILVTFSALTFVNLVRTRAQAVI